MKRMPLAAARRLFDGLVIAMLVCAVLFTLSFNFFLGCAVILLGLAATAFLFAVLRCPHCGRPLVPKLRCAEKYAEAEGWHQAAERYESFLRTRSGQRILFLELGVGYNTPGIIKYPFRRMTANNPKATYACVNLGQTAAPPASQSQSLLLDGDIGEILQTLAR